jgi:hypothetical protein
MASAAWRALHGERCMASAAWRALHIRTGARRLELRRQESARRVANYFYFYLLQTGAGLLL